MELRPDADELVRRYVLRQYGDTGMNPHLRGCPGRRIEVIDGGNGTYGCDTGCEYVHFEATVTCPHGETDDDYEWGEFGDMAGIIEDMEREAARESR